MRHVFIACLLGLRPLSVQAAVNLSPATSPATAQPAVTVVTVVGSGFPSGSIPPANVTVTLTPTQSGGAITTQATAVQPIFGTTQRVTFQIPGSVAPVTPATYRVSISGTTSGGTAFSSGNSAALTINPAPQIASLSPSLGSAAVNMQVTITGLYTNFLQGVTQANFGPGISVGGAPEGQPGPVTVTSPTTAVAQIAIDQAANPGSQSVSIVTGAQSSTNFFSVEPVVAVVNVDMTTTANITPNVSGFDDEFMTHGVEYWDPKYLAFVAPMKPGWLRFPGGTPSMAFDWQAGHLVTSWIKYLAPLVGQFPATSMLRGYQLTQAKGGVYLSDYATYAKSFGAFPIICINGYTDNHPGSAANMVTAAQSYGLNVHEWELSNEPWEYNQVFANANVYATSQIPYNQGILSINPNAITGIDYQGQYSGGRGTWEAWDTGLQTFTPQYWNGVSVHVYPVATGNLTTIETQAVLNGFLAHGTNEYLNSYLQPLIGANTPLFITEVNDGHSAGENFKSYIFNAIYLAEFTLRMSIAPTVKAIGITNLYQGNTGNSGMIRVPNDFETYLINQVIANPNFSTNTATDPNTQFMFYYSAPGLAMQIVNQAVNSSTQVWPTTVTGGPMVGITGYDNQPIQGLYAQGYLGNDGTHYVVVTNKSALAVPLGLEVNGSLLEQPVTISYISNSNAEAQNTATDENYLQIVNTTSPNPITVGPFSVMRIQW